ncbi:MAG: tyrosyl-trna synthetase [Pseudomonas sp.]|nr:tyrosyl-trna synthetase [Pseudomonas sp.]
MFIRSMTLATLLAVAGPLWAADSDGPLAQDIGKSRPLIIMADSSLDPTLVKLKAAMSDPATRDGFTQRNVVLYTVVKSIGQRDGKDLDAQSAMALVRELKLGAGAQPRVILVGKDGEKKMEHSGPIDAKEIFAAIDQLPPQEKEAAPPPLPAAAEAKPAKGGKAAKPGKPGKPAAPAEPPKDLDD